MKPKRYASTLLLSLSLFAAGCGEEKIPGVDIDLARKSSTFIYATVSQMMENPDSYVGKVIRIAGYYSYYSDNQGNALYHACMVPDAMACCSQGLEFVLAEDLTWPDEYPDEGTDIYITGRLETYKEGKNTLLHLVDCEMELQEES